MLCTGTLMDRRLSKKNPQPPGALLVKVERAVWREITKHVHGDMTLKETISHVLGDSTFWQLVAEGLGVDER